MEEEAEREGAMQRKQRTFIAIDVHTLYHLFIGILCLSPRHGCRAEYHPWDCRRARSTCDDGHTSFVSPFFLSVFFSSRLLLGAQATVIIKVSIPSFATDFGYCRFVVHNSGKPNGQKKEERLLEPDGNGRL